jgi:uncharacterized protein YqfA (UPF0365 family)
MNVFLGIVIVLGIGLLFVISRYFSLWLQAFLSGSPVPFLTLVLMSLRKVNPRIIVRCKVTAVQAGLADFSIKALEAHYLAGGDVQHVTLALVVANRARIPLDWDTAAAIDLAGRNVVEAVQVSVNPKIIDCPDPNENQDNMLYGVARDGIQLKVRVRVTVRTNLSQLVGGATESTVVARIGQSIISAIGSCDSYRDALGDPMVISRKVIAEGLDAQTAFSIVSIDIADIDVGTNIGAKLRIDQADANIRIARANAEKRRAMAVANYHEMRALVAEKQALLVLAEAQIPSALSFAIRQGTFYSEKKLALNG